MKATAVGEDVEKDHRPLSHSGCDTWQVPEQGAVLSSIRSLWRKTCSPASAPVELSEHLPPRDVLWILRRRAFAQ